MNVNIGEQRTMVNLRDASLRQVEVIGFLDGKVLCRDRAGTVWKVGEDFLKPARDDTP